MVYHTRKDIERGLLLLLLVHMKRFLPPTGGSSDTSTGTQTCGEPTCKHKSRPLTAIHKCPCGRPMHAFCGRGIGDEGHGQQRMCTDCQKRTDEGDGDDRPESCITSSLSEAEVHSRFEELRSYLYANGTGGEYSETQHLLSKTVHSFTHETQVKRRAKPRGEVQGTLRDMWREKPSG